MSWELAKREVGVAGRKKARGGKELGHAVGVANS